MKERIALGLGTLLIAVSLLGASLTLSAPIVASAEGSDGMAGLWGSMQGMMAACTSAIGSTADQTGER